MCVAFQEAQASGLSWTLANKELRLKFKQTCVGDSKGYQVLFFSFYTASCRTCSLTSEEAKIKMENCKYFWSKDGVMW